jgi:redox-regulated HSP33 family molecular chaperone
MTKKITLRTANSVWGKLDLMADSADDVRSFTSSASQTFSEILERFELKEISRSKFERAVRMVQTLAAHEKEMKALARKAESLHDRLGEL